MATVEKGMEFLFIKENVKSFSLFFAWDWSVLGAGTHMLGQQISNSDN